MLKALIAVGLTLTLFLSSCRFGNSSIDAVNQAQLVAKDGPNFDFGLVDVNSQSRHSFTFTNLAAVSATGMVVANVSAPYSISANTCTGTVARVRVAPSKYRSPP